MKYSDGLGQFCAAQTGEKGSINSSLVISYCRPGRLLSRKIKPNIKIKGIFFFCMQVYVCIFYIMCLHQKKQQIKTKSCQNFDLAQIDQFKEITRVSVCKPLNGAVLCHVFLPSAV